MVLDNLQSQPTASTHCSPSIGGLSYSTKLSALPTLQRKHLAACDLKGKYRIPLSDTPIQNEYTDLQGLLRFMRVAPWDKLDFFKQASLQTQNQALTPLKKRLVLHA